MYGKAYQAETILRKKKRRPFAKEIIKEVNEGEDLFNALFSHNIKDVKQKVKQEKTQCIRPRKNKVSQRPIFIGIPEIPECDEFLDPFDALLMDTRGHVGKNNVNVCNSQSTSGAKIHGDGKENSPKGENCSIFGDKKKKIFFESNFQGCTKKISGTSASKKTKRPPLKLKSGGKDSQVSGKVKEKLNHDHSISILTVLDSSCDSDLLEAEFKTKREELRKKEEERKIIVQSKKLIQTECKEQVNTCSGNDSYSVCSCSSSPNHCSDGKGNAANFLSSTPARHDSSVKQSRVNRMKHAQKRECIGNECHYQSSTREELPFLSPILSVTDQRLRKSSDRQQNENISSLGFLRRRSSEIEESQISMKCWKKMYRKHNPILPIQKITVQPYIHANYEDSGSGEDCDTDKSVSCISSSSEESVKNFSDNKESVCLLQQSVDPFADSDDLHEQFQKSVECLAESETQLKEKQEQSSVTRECVTDNSGNKVPQECNESDRKNFSNNSIEEVTNRSKNNCKCEYMKHIEEDYIGCSECQNSLKENCTNLRDSINSPSIKNVCFRKDFKSVSRNSEEKQDAFNAENDSKKSFISDSREASSFSDITSSSASERNPEPTEISSQAGSVSEKMSHLSLSESRGSCRAMKKKSFAQRGSHRVVPLAQRMGTGCGRMSVVPLAQRMGTGCGRMSGFWEVYCSLPLPELCMDKLSESLPDERPNSVSKHEDSVSGNVSGEGKKGGITFKDVVLEHCGQSDILAFDEAFLESDLANCKKIGEGVYGEVFARLNSQQQQIVMKIMPIEGDCQINGEKQKSFEEILPEIVISAQLSSLRESEDFNTSNFPELINCWCVQGEYPPKLLKLWQDFDEEKTSENDSPEILPEDQIYIILELSNVGSALESFTFNSAEQSWSAFMQVAYTLAVAEASLEFEHRDLHWGNILIRPTKDKTITCKMYGEDTVVPTQGIQASVIDFTLSRITYDGCCIYNNLADDPALFEGQGDYQFDIYRMMQDKNENNWQVFQPYSNVLWLSYVLEKLIDGAYYRNEKTKVHKRGLGKLKEMRSRILDFQSAAEVALSLPSR